MKVKFLKEVYSDKQRDYMCHMKGDKAKRPKGLSQDEAEEMCTGPMKEEPLEEMSSAGGGGSPGGSKPEKELDEMYSTSGHFSAGDKVPDVDEFKGLQDRAEYLGVKNVSRKWKIKFPRRLREAQEETYPLSADDLEDIKADLEDDATGPLQGAEVCEGDWVKWQLVDFANNSRNASRTFDVLREIEEEIGMEELQQAALEDKSAPSRTEVMSTKFGYDLGLYERIKNGDEEAVQKYYQFLINEFLFWISLNPMSSAQQYAGRCSMLSRATKDIAFTLVQRYVWNPTKNNPKAMGFRVGQQADFYKLTRDLDPALYELPEE